MLEILENQFKMLNFPVYPMLLKINWTSHNFFVGITFPPPSYTTHTLKDRNNTKYLLSLCSPLSNNFLFIKGLHGETETRGIYISCLSLDYPGCFDEKGNHITPMFNQLMKEMFSELSKELEVGIGIVF